SGCPHGDPVFLLLNAAKAHHKAADHIKTRYRGICDTPSAAADESWTLPPTAAPPTPRCPTPIVDRDRALGAETVPGAGEPV
ncbi:hypothetical protein, partial [Escherichia coli]|uniref:hypothetical protein n=1 Tax=Escherichia coli TaxID=562 RepID=UPI001953EC53